MIERFGELGFHLPSLIVYGLNFGILFTLLYVVAYKPILRMLDQRSSTIQDSMEQAERIRQEAAQAEERVKARLEEARREGQGIVNQAGEAGERVKEEARAEARRETESILSRARLETQRERDEALDALRQEFADLALRAAEKVINQALDRKAHHRLIEEALEESSLKKE
ncbi:MAG: F0F1 ATP synthase subunit B [Dehalococcoidia bacterium]